MIRTRIALYTTSIITLAALYMVPSSLRAADLPAPAKPSTQPIAVPASIEAFEQVDLYPKLSGFIANVNVDIGDAVKSGQVLAVINDPELERDLTEAKAMLEARQKMLEAAEATVKQSMQTLEVSKRQVGRYQAEARLQEVTRKRQEELFAGKAITQQQLDDVRSKAEIAVADADVAVAKVGAAEADVKGAEAARAVAGAQVEVATAQIQKIMTMLEYRSVIAPFDGVVARRQVNRGDLVQAATSTRAFPLFTVQRIDVVRVRCDIPESAVMRIAVGMSAAVKVPSTPGEPFSGTVTRTARSLNPETRTMRVEVDLPNPQGRLLPGMFAMVTLTPSAEMPASAPAK